MMGRTTHVIMAICLAIGVLPAADEDLSALVRKGDNAAVAQWLEKHPDLDREVGAGALVLAASEGATEIVGTLLKHRVAVNARTSVGTALSAAAAAGRTDTVELLLKSGAYPESLGEAQSTPLILASKYGHVATVKALLAGGAKVNGATPDGITALIVCAFNSRVEVAKLLLEAKADPNIRSAAGKRALAYAKDEGMIELLEAAGGTR